MRTNTLLKILSRIALLLILCVSPLAHAQTQTETKKTIGPWSYSPGTSPSAKILPDISVIGSLAGGYFSTDPTGETGHDPARSGITLQEIELGLQSSVDPYFRADVFLSFLEEGVELEEGFVTTTFIKRLSFKAGKFLMPFGRQNQKHLHVWPFADQMLVNKYLLGPEGFSELGIQAAYVLPLPFYAEIQAAFANGENEGNFDGVRKEDFVYTGRVATSFDITNSLTLLFGGSMATGFNGTGLGNATSLYAGDMLWRYKKTSAFSLDWQSEYMLRRREVPGLLRSDGGLSTYLDARIGKRWGAALRLDWMGLPSSEIVKEWKITPAVTFRPTEFSQIRLQYALDKSDGTSEIHAAIMQLVFSFGAHAAHKY